MVRIYNWLLAFGDPRFALLQQTLENATSHHVFSIGCCVSKNRLRHVNCHTSSGRVLFRSSYCIQLVGRHLVAEKAFSLW